MKNKKCNYCGNSTDGEFCTKNCSRAEKRLILEEAEDIIAMKMIAGILAVMAVVLWFLIKYFR